jgi:methyl-accepting chemotaxis protein
MRVGNILRWCISEDGGRNAAIIPACADARAISSIQEEINMLGKLRIGPKLLLAPGVVLLLLIVLSSGAYYAMVRQNQSLETIVRQRAVHIRDASELVSAAHHAHTEIYQLLAWVSASFSRARVDALIANLHQRHIGIDRRFSALTKVTEPGSAERRFIEQAEAAHAQYLKAVQDVIEISQMDQSISANAMSTAERAFEMVALRLSELLRLEQELSERASASAASDFRIMSVLMPIVIGISIVLSLAITMAVRSALLREVREIGEAAVDLASGNLTVKERVYGKDEISETSRALDTSIRNLNGTLRNILESARSIGTASREIAAGNASLTSRTEAQANSLEQTASSMEQLTVTVNMTANSALVANQLAESASSVAQKGGDVVERLVTTMASIKLRSGRVLDIVGVIDGIASQTNTLALSAAVEAARAGEHGRGFTAVAAEVRTLAQRSATAAMQIKDLIVQAVAEIDGGSASVTEAGDNMAEIATSVKRVGDLVSEISNASAEQASGMLEMNHAILQMDQMTHQNSALVDEAAAAAESLQAQALSLARAVASFRLDESSPPPAPLAIWPERGARNGTRPYLRLASSRA